MCRQNRDPTDDVIITGLARAVTTNSCAHTQITHMHEHQLLPAIEIQASPSFDSLASPSQATLGRLDPDPSAD